MNNTGILFLINLYFTLSVDIKVVDLLAPYAKCEKIWLFGGARV
jgi:F0F1-type ATP synthase beta subunit